MEFVIVGKMEKSKDELKKTIQRMGGKLGTTIHANVAAIISNQKEIKRFGARMEDAKKYGIQVVPEDFLDDVKNGGAVSFIISKSLCDWGTDVNNYIQFFAYNLCLTILKINCDFITAQYPYSPR